MANSFSMQPALRIVKGATFSEVVRWEVAPTVYTPFTAATKAAPVVLTSASHGLPDGWRVKRITSVLGMTQLNTHALKAGVWTPTALGDAFPSGLKLTKVDANTIKLNDVNAASYDTYVSGGVLESNTPQSLSGYTARMQIRDNPDSAEILLELTTSNGGITLDDTTKTITLLIAATATEALDFTSGVCTLEMVSAGGVVTMLMPNRAVIVGNTDVTR